MLRVAPTSASYFARRAAVLALLGASIVGAPVRTAQAQPIAALTPQAAAKLKVLDAYLGTWDVTVRSRVPKPVVVTHTEVGEWVLGQRFMRIDSGRKSDGSQDVIMISYFEAAGGYPLWLFSSLGVVYTLAPGVWDAATRTLTWKSPAGAAISYESQCVFPTPTTRRCKTLSKDWKGAPVLDLDVSAVRRP